MGRRWAAPGRGQGIVVGRSTSSLGMAIEVADAGQRATQALVDEFASRIELTLVSEVPGGAYGIDSAEWWLFAALVTNEQRVGGSQYVAVHKETGAVRKIGAIGE